VQERVLFETLVDIVHIGGRYYLSLVCTFENAIEKFEVKVAIQKGPLRFRETNDNRCVSFIQFKIPFIVFTK
jgi:hypothetical protein